MSRRYVRDQRGRFASSRSGVVSARPRPAQPAPKPGSMAATLRASLQAMAQSDARMIREIEALTGGKVRRTTSKPSGKAAPASGRMTDALGGGLRNLAQSDARYFRELGGLAGGGSKSIGGGQSKRLKGSTAKPKQKP